MAKQLEILSPEPKPRRKAQGRAVAKVAGDVSRIKKVAFEPCSYRPERYARKPSKAQEKKYSSGPTEVSLLIMSIGIGYLIQERCGLYPLTEHEKYMFDLLYHPFPKPGVEVWEPMVPYYVEAQRLIEDVACSHCVARFDCKKLRAP